MTSCIVTCGVGLVLVSSNGGIIMYCIRSVNDNWQATTVHHVGRSVGRSSWKSRRTGFIRPLPIRRRGKGLATHALRTRAEILLLNYLRVGRSWKGVTAMYGGIFFLPQTNCNIMSYIILYFVCACARVTFARVGCRA